ncbi:hypothetical protein MKX03_010814, partial [Papaver bracteatum]
CYLCTHPVASIICGFIYLCICFNLFFCGFIFLCNRAPRPSRVDISLFQICSCLP